MSHDETLPPQTEPTPIGYEADDGAIRKLLGTLDRPAGRFELVHQWIAYNDSFQIVLVRPDHRPFILSFHHKHVATLRAALDAFEKRVRDRHSAREEPSRPLSSSRPSRVPPLSPVQQRLHTPGIPRGRTAP